MGNERPGVLPCFLQTGAQVCSVHSFCNSAPLTGQFSFILPSIFPYLRLPIYLFVWAVKSESVYRVCLFTLIHFILDIQHIRYS